MHIVKAVPVPEYAKVPARALVDPRIGKGEIATLGRIALYLVGKQRPLEGTAQEFADVLGIEKHNWQRHIPTLGSSGYLSWSRPQRGLYVLLEILYPALYDEATILSFPVVVPELFNQDSEPREEQQQSFGSALGGSVRGESQSDKIVANPDEATKLSLTSEESAKVCTELAEFLTLQAAQELAYTYPSAQIRRQIAHYRWARKNGKAGGPGWLVDAIKGDYELPPALAREHRQQELASDRSAYAEGIRRMGGEVMT